MNEYSVIYLGFQIIRFIVKMFRTTFLGWNGSASYFWGMMPSV
jgi:hypothetical protein